MKPSKSPEATMSHPVMRMGEVNGPVKTWLVSLLSKEIESSKATDDLEVHIFFKRPASSIPPRQWTPELNNRRCDLIAKEFKTGLTAEEEIELEDLTKEVDRFIDRVAPIPLEGVLREHQRLLELASRSDTGS